MKNLFLLFTLFINFNAFSQNYFESGKIILKNGTIIECFIQNKFDKNNPTSIVYKINLQSEKETMRAAEIESAEIFNKIKFISANVDFDFSSSNVSNMNTDRNPQYKKTNALLIILVDSEVSLYKLTINDITNYYYKREGEDYTHLVYKKFYVDMKKSNIAENNHYIYQLNTYVNCNNGLVSHKAVKYNENNLIKYFKEYNQCIGAEKITTPEKVKPFHFNVFIGYGLNMSKVNFTNTEAYTGAQGSDNHGALNVGAQFEINLSSYHRRWAVISEASYTSINGNITTDEVSNTYSNIDYKYSTINIRAGFRHNIFYKYDSKYPFYIDFMIGLGVVQNGSLEREYIRNATSHSSASSTLFSYDENFKNSITGGMGLGFPIYNKFGGSLRYNFTSNVLNETSNIFAKLNTTSISLNLHYHF